jgi:hypothetical protein
LKVRRQVPEAHPEGPAHRLLPLGAVLLVEGFKTGRIEPLADFVEGLLDPEPFLADQLLERPVDQLEQDRPLAESARQIFEAQLKALRAR